MQCIRPNAIAFRQDGVCSCIHHLIASGALWLRTKKIWNPPGHQRTVACKSVCDPQPPKQPARIASTKVKGAGSESDRNRSEIDQRGNQKFACRELCSNPVQVIESP